MEISAYQAYSILDIIGGAILGKTGEITVPFLMETPECYSSHISDIEYRHNEMYRAFKHIEYGYIHKQDIFLRRQFIPEHVIQGDGFLSRADKVHFTGREYIHHFCVLNFTLSGLKSLSDAYVKNPLSYKEHLVKHDREKLSAFLENVENAVTILNNIPGIRLSSLPESDIKKYVYNYVTGFYYDNCLRDIRFEDKIRIGEKEGVFLAICDENYLPETLKTHVRDTTLQTSNAALYMPVLEELGIHLHCTHVINQVWHFRGKDYNNELAARVRKFGQHKEFDKEIEVKHKGLVEYQDKIANEENVLCKTHFNIMLLEDDPGVLQKSVERVKSITANAGFRCYIPSHEGLYNIFIGSVSGRNTILHESYFYLSDLHGSLCLNINYTTFQHDDEGILFSDRIFQVPLRKDVWDARKRRIPARNAIVVASTGGGKSVTTLNIIQQLLEQGVKVIVVEFGKSFYQLGQLYKDKTLHVDYDGESPLGINPFRLVPGTSINNDKIRTLADLVLKFWRTKAVMEDTAQVVSLMKIINRYYQDIREGHNFPSFYKYVQTCGSHLMEELNIKKEYFDLDGFIHICSDFIQGGMYENVCKYSPLEEEMEKKDFIIFELTRIKKDPFLISVVMTILFDAIESKILSDRSVRGMLVFDEYAESAQIKDLFSGSDIHSTVAFCYQKLRKENGAIMTVIQSPAQLPRNEFTDGIIANTQLLYVLPTNEVVYEDVRETFKMVRENQVALMKSMKNDFSCKRPYSEIFIRFLDHYATVVRLELSPEKFLAFQTDGEMWSAIQESYKQTNSIEESISEIKNRNLQNHEKNTIF